MKQIYRNKKIIWESRQKQVALIIGNLLLVAAIIWTKDRSSSIYFWSALMFFGGGALFFLIRFINPSNLFVTHNTELGKQILADQFKKAQEDLGFFMYSNTGFGLTTRKGVTHYNWLDIVTVFGFKEDRLTTDEICMDIHFEDKESIRLTESTPGWYQFNLRLCKAIPTIPENWDTKIALPPFASNMTLLFDKNDRSKEQAEKECYSG